MEEQYLELIKNILLNGEYRKNRTDIYTLAIFGCQLRFDLSNSFPLLTTKKIFWRGIVEELLWFIKGSTDVKELQKKNIHIWDNNSSREYFDKIGLLNREEGDLGPIYGFQWRYSGAEYKTCHDNYSNKGVDQLETIINTIRTNPNDRRMVLCSWNPSDIPKMALPPCHCLAQFFVSKGKLSCQLYQRSADVGLGVPFNIASYALLTYMIAHITNLQPGELIHIMGDTHIYTTHIEGLRKQTCLKPYPFPRLNIKRKVENINDFTFEDFELENYISHPAIKLNMVT